MKFERKLKDRRQIDYNARFVDGRRLTEYEEFARKRVTLGAHFYKVEVSLGHVLDHDDVIVEESYLVRQKNDPQQQYMMHIIELKDENTVFNTIREIKLLKHLGTSKYILSAYGQFRHRQYVCFLNPPFVSIRNYIDAQMRFRENGGVTADGRPHQHELNDAKTESNRVERERQILVRVGLFSRNTVAYVLRKVIKGVNFVHSKGYAHTELCAHNIFLDSVSNVKIGGFLHLKKLDSTKWTLTSDPTCRPPEAFDDQTVGRKVEKSVDYWGLGMLTLELITGHRNYLSEETAKLQAIKYLTGKRSPPALADLESNSIVNGVQVYDPHIDDFISRLLDPEPRKRLCYDEAIMHPFIRNPIDLVEAYRQLKINVAIYPVKRANQRRLFSEMTRAQGSCLDIKEDLLHNIVQALKHVRNEDYFLFKKPKESTLCKDYIGIEACTAVPYDDTNWSRDVLDISEDYPEQKLSASFDTPEPLGFLDVSSPEITEKVKSDHPGEKKNYNRYETCFFVKKSWGITERQVFVGMQFARWYENGVIDFPDLIRLSDEVEEVINDYIINKTRLTSRSTIPDSVYFASPRRDLVIDGWSIDSEFRYLAHIYVDVALSAEVNYYKFQKMNTLLLGENTVFPPNTSPLQSAVSYQDCDHQKFEFLEAEMLGQMNVANWDVDDREDSLGLYEPGSEIYCLLWERHFSQTPDNINPDYNRDINNNAIPPPSDDESSEDEDSKKDDVVDDTPLFKELQKARETCTRRRNYMYNVKKWAQPKGTANDLYGGLVKNKETVERVLEKDFIKGDISNINVDRQLARTTAKLEGDTSEQFKKIEDLRLRRDAAEKHKRYFKGQRTYHNLTNQITRSDAFPMVPTNYLATPGKRNVRFAQGNYKSDQY